MGWLEYHRGAITNSGVWSYEGVAGAHVMFYGLCFGGRRVTGRELLFPVVTQTNMKLSKGLGGRGHQYLFYASSLCLPSFLWLIIIINDDETLDTRHKSN
ncbi:hypothetical protein L6452_04443 [Arctium lappa]|uniref:Uncharacterized protein n=1 Tax=Arctium lappa TaxID=4217 RepID=A0ACB9EEN5_ARCLA|nr:hypothetical protein L6452_04443 [Arctium lappa]